MRHANGKMRLLPLVAATYFMVAGGPYGLEDILGDAGYARAPAPAADHSPHLEPAPPRSWSANSPPPCPCRRGVGYYVWVRRALGGFWGFQEAWLSLAASVFDMAIYPVLFVLYLSRLAPALTAGARGTLWELAVILLCTLWNLRGAKSVGQGSVAMMSLLLAPFVVLVLVALWNVLFAHAPGSAETALSARFTHSFALLRSPVAAPSFAGAVSVALWNYMGWDNASTIAQEVEDPQRNYPRAMLLSAALVALTYIVPLLAVGLAGMNPARFSTGAWTDAARFVAGPPHEPARFGSVLALAVVVGGMLNGGGMFNALMLSYARVPYALAQDGLLPRFLTRTAAATPARAPVPWASILVCAIAWALALKLSFERLISIDLVLYGASLLLEFVALAVLRVREPALHRPFRIPGGLPAAIAAGAGPVALIAFALYAARAEHVGPLPALAFAALIAAAGPLAWLLGRLGASRS